MSKIGPKNSSQEIYIRKILFALGYRFRLHKKDLPGKPDIVLPRYKKVIFINGCFWHGHKNCKRSILPTSNKAFWKRKIESNIIRDKKNKIQLKKIGWSYLILWQCQIGKSKINSIEKVLINFIESTK